LRVKINKRGRERLAASDLKWTSELQLVTERLNLNAMEMNDRETETWSA
jgi:hypothetical protein